MSAGRISQITLLLVLWYFLAGLVGSRVLGLWPTGFEGEGFFLVGAALPWSLSMLGFYQPTDNPFGALTRDLLFFVLLAGSIAVNAVIANAIIGRLIRGRKLQRSIRRISDGRPIRRRR